MNIRDEQWYTQHIAHMVSNYEHILKHKKVEFIAVGIYMRRRGGKIVMQPFETTQYSYEIPFPKIDDGINIKKR
jgi:hypothetical protein